MSYLEEESQRYNEKESNESLKNKCYELDRALGFSEGRFKGLKEGYDIVKNRLKDQELITTSLELSIGRFLRELTICKCIKDKDALAHSFHKYLVESGHIVGDIE